MSKTANAVGPTETSNGSSRRGIFEKSAAAVAFGATALCGFSGIAGAASETSSRVKLQRHLDLTSGEVVGRLKKDWAADIKSYDDGHVHMLMFADALTDGIVKQFPVKFAA